MIENHQQEEGAADKETVASNLAIGGGQPAINLSLPSWPPRWPSVERSVAASIADGSWGQYHGRSLVKFTESFRQFAGVDHVWPCASGTIAVELALRGLGVTNKHRVLMAGYDFPGNFRAIEALGARPVLVDVIANGLVIDPIEVDKAIALFNNDVTNAKIKAVIVSHLHGQLAELAEIRAICEPAGIAVLEDACQVPGAIVNGKVVGTTGHVGVFSFGGSKLLTAGRGGAVITNDEEILQRIRISAERGNDAYPLSALQASALTPQLELIEGLNQQRLISARRLSASIKTSSQLRTIVDTHKSNCQTAFYKFPIMVGDSEPSPSRGQWIAAMKAEGLPAAEGFRGFTKRSKRRCDKVGPLPNSALAASQTILLHHPLLLGSDNLLEQAEVAIKKVDTHFQNHS